MYHTCAIWPHGLAIDTKEPRRHVGLCDSGQSWRMLLVYSLQLVTLLPLRVPSSWETHSSHSDVVLSSHTLVLTHSLTHCSLTHALAQSFALSLAQCVPRSPSAPPRSRLQGGGWTVAGDDRFLSVTTGFFLFGSHPLTFRARKSIKKFTKRFL